MTTAYQTQPVAPYDSHVMPSYSTAFAPSRMPTVSDPLRVPQYSRYSQNPPHQAPAQQQQPFSYPTQARDPASGSSHYSLTARHSSRSSTPATTDMAGHEGGSASRRSSQSLIHHSLQIPTLINPKGGNLADFAAQITCLFWFESMDTLRAAEAIRTRPQNAPVARLTKYAVPYSAFKKWAYTVLSTTQVTQSVILLALLFIYRLKKINPSVKGRAGSEYRLLTVALMLGNKFLDDNTYTNKTWAEVSGISVTEIHVMEVEFLSNMRYSLLATKDEWEEWLAKLACFSEYYDRALRHPTSPIALSSPGAQGYNSPLPSPTAVAPGITSSTTTWSPMSTTRQNSQAWPASYQSNLALSPLSAKSNLAAVSKKRAHEDDLAEHPAKRPTLQQPTSMTPAQRPPVVGEQPIRLPVPNLTLNTNATVNPNAGSTYLAPTGYPNAVPAHVSLPPLVSGVRAMAAVYPPATSSGAPLQLPLPVSAPSTMAPTTVTPTPPMAAHPALGYGTPSKRHSPGMLPAFGSSPMTDGYHISAVHTPISHTPISHSPSVYLQQRQSPYKPIRHVNTLLYPPPSASLHEYHMSMTAPQMHYLPLGRRNDLRTGVVPEYMTMAYRNMPPVQLGSQGYPMGHPPN